MKKSLFSPLTCMSMRIKIFVFLVCFITSVLCAPTKNSSRNLSSYFAAEEQTPDVMVQKNSSENIPTEEVVLHAPTPTKNKKKKRVKTHKSKDKASEHKTNTQKVPLPPSHLDTLKDKKEETYSAWAHSMTPWNFNGDENGAIMLNFVSTDLMNVLKYFESAFGVIFITDDAIQPLTTGGKSLLGSKVNFSTNRPVSRKEAWNILITLLETAGVTLQPGSMERTYRVSTLAKESPYNYRKGPLPVYIGVSPDELPDADMRIRYLYQVKNTSLETVKSIVQAMQSAASPDPIDIPEIYSVLITDRVYNIKTMLAVIYELDQSTMPEALSIVKLEKADANKVVELYKTLTKDDSGAPNPGRLLGPRRSNETLAYFDPTVRMIPEPRTNSLILLGPSESLAKLEKFIKDFEDQDSRVPYIPTFTYQLKYTQAEAVARILEAAIDFKSDSEAGKVGGIRNGDKYFSSVTIVAEPATNTLLISAPEDEYWHLHDLLQEIDIEQPQVALDVMMITVSTDKNKAIGSQLRNAQGLLGNNVNFQTGLFDSSIGVVGNYATDTNGNLNTGNSRLLSNLLQLVTGNSQSTGTTLLTLGSDPNGVLGIVRMLEKESETKIINHPWLVTTNNYPAAINVGETRRIAATQIINSNNSPQQSYTSDDARIQVKITPQVSGHGLVTLTINIEQSQFNGPSGDTITAGNKTSNSMNTSVLIRDGDIIAIGGLNQETSTENQSSVPFFSKIPILGWLFKSRKEEKKRSSLIVLIRTHIMPASYKNSEKDIAEIAEKSKNYVRSRISDSKLCPVTRWFFNDKEEEKKSFAHLEDFVHTERRRRPVPPSLSSESAHA